MLKTYIQAAMGKARYEILSDDGTFYAEIVGFDGVWANADTLEACRDELEEVLEGWILLRVSRHMPLPTVDGIKLPVGEVVRKAVDSRSTMLTGTSHDGVCIPGGIEEDVPGEIGYIDS